MMNLVLLYAGAALPLIWGVAHLFPTRNVVAGFGDISLDNKRVITMEWINEAAALVFISAVVFAATFIDHTSPVSQVSLRRPSLTFTNFVPVRSFRIGPGASVADQ